MNFAACWRNEKPHRESVQSSRFDLNRQSVLTVLKCHQALLLITMFFVVFLAINGAVDINAAESSHADSADRIY